jgi:hypothetical protein
MTPSLSIVHGAGKPKNIEDKAGRRLLVRTPSALDTLRLFKAAGPTLAQNEPWLSMAALACSVLEVDGVPIPSPMTESQIESVIDKLGEVGLVAVAEHLNAATEYSGIAGDDLGNLPGTLF